MAPLLSGGGSETFVVHRPQNQIAKMSRDGTEGGSLWGVGKEGQETTGKAKDRALWTL